MCQTGARSLRLWEGGASGLGVAMRSSWIGTYGEAPEYHGRWREMWAEKRNYRLGIYFSLAQRVAK